MSIAFCFWVERDVLMRFSEHAQILCVAHEIAQYLNFILFENLPLNLQSDKINGIWAIVDNNNIA